MKNAQNSAPVPPVLETSNPPQPSDSQAKKTATADRILRVKDLVKPHGILPICRSTFYHLIKSGIVGPGIRLGRRTRAWKESEIKNLIDRLEAEGGRNG